MGDHCDGVSGRRNRRVDLIVRESRVGSGF